MTDEVEAVPAPTDGALSRAELRSIVEDSDGRIRRIVLQAGSRSGLSDEELEDFSSDVIVKLLEDDYARLRAFSGRSSLNTYLRTVVVNLLRDHRNHLWGKYRPSKAAKRFGRTAVLLDQLVRRDRRTAEEAIATLATRPDIPENRQELAAILEQLPERLERRTDSGAEEILLAQPATSDASSRQQRHELEENALPVARGLENALQALETEDRLLVRLRWFEGQTVAMIAKTLQLDAPKTYRRFEKILGQLRRGLASQGLEERRILELLRYDEELDLGHGGAADSPQVAPDVRPNSQESEDRI